MLKGTWSFLKTIGHLTKEETKIYLLRIKQSFLENKEKYKSLRVGDLCIIYGMFIFIGLVSLTLFRNLFNESWRVYGNREFMPMFFEVNLNY